MKWWTASQNSFPKSRLRAPDRVTASTLMKHTGVAEPQPMENKRVSIAIAALALAAPAAFAQTSAPTAPSAAPPAASSTQSGNLQFYSHQATEMRASKLIGVNIRNTANESIGEINELILDKDGKVRRGGRISWAWRAPGCAGLQVSDHQA